MKFYFLVFIFIVSCGDAVYASQNNTSEHRNRSPVKIKEIVVKAILPKVLGLPKIALLLPPV